MSHAPMVRFTVLVHVPGVSGGREIGVLSHPAQAPTLEAELQAFIQQHQPALDPEDRIEVRRPDGSRVADLPALIRVRDLLRADNRSPLSTKPALVSSHHGNRVR